MPVWMLERERAKEAYACVREVARLDSKVQQRYRSQSRGGSAMIQRNGLGQYLAFLASRGFMRDALRPASGKTVADHADGLLYQHLGRWLARALKVQDNLPDAKNVKPGAGRTLDPLDFLLDASCTLEQTMLATREALAYLQWARRFAESQLSAPETLEDRR